MATPNDFLLLTREATTVAAVSAALGMNGQVQERCQCTSSQDLERRLDRAAVPVVLVDLDGPSPNALNELEPLVARYPATRFVVMSSELKADVVLAAMQIGARHFLLKRSIGAELPGVMDRFLAQSTHCKATGTVITVLSAGGGCGATTIAVNLAHELAAGTGEATLLADLDIAYGGAGAYLGVRAKYGIADVLASGQRIDEHLIRTTATDHGRQLHVLASPATTNPARPASLIFNDLARAVDAARRAYSFMVIDAPRVPPDVAATLAAESNLTLIVLQATVKDLHIAKVLASVLRERGVDRGAVKAVINRYHRRSPMIAFDECVKVLGDLTVECLPNDFSNAVHAINYGQFLAQSAGRSSLRKELTQWVSALIETRQSQQTAVATR